MSNDAEMLHKYAVLAQAAYGDLNKTMSPQEIIDELKGARAGMAELQATNFRE